MHIKRLFLKNFRNYEEVTVFFEKGINYILGKNAQGKTNLLEAIYLLITGRSFRDRDLRNCISFNADFFYLEATFEKQDLEQSLTFYFSVKGRKISHNGTPLKSLTELLGTIPGVLFCPKDINLIVGFPAFRRVFINLLLSQSNHEYITGLSRYTQSVNQRNALLKSNQLKGIDCWEEQIASYGAHLIQSRHKSIVLFNDILTKTSHRLEFKDSFTLKYRGSVSDSPEDYNKTRLHILKSLEKNRPKEIMLKRTLYGPHRDDLDMLLNDKSVALFASEGQKRSLLALIKMTERYFLKLNFPEINPIFCLDDLNISLDIERSSKILSEFSRTGQSFITSCNSTSNKAHPGNIIFIDSGHPVSILKI